MAVHTWQWPSNFCIARPNTSVWTPQGLSSLSLSLKRLHFNGFNFKLYSLNQVKYDLQLSASVLLPLSARTQLGHLDKSSSRRGFTHPYNICISLLKSIWGITKPKRHPVAHSKNAKLPTVKAEYCIRHFIHLYLPEARFEIQAGKVASTY